MKETVSTPIARVKAVQPSTPGSPNDWRTWMGQILVRVECEDGLEGVGIGGGGRAGIHVVETVLRHVLVGQSPDDIEGLWEQMYASTLPFGQKGLAIMALSGVDLALWDLRGKRAGKSVAELLGPPRWGPIPAYRTVFMDLEEALGQEYQFLKLHLGRFDPARGVDEVAEFVRRARETFGEETSLMVDAFMSWDIETALQVAEKIEPYRIDWLEEPLPADDLEGYARLRDECPIPIAGGEHEYTAKGFKVLIDNRLHSILQPDVCWCGGMTELLKVYRMAAEAGLRVIPHRGSEVWGLHAVASIDPQPLAESGRSWMAWIKGQPVIEKGSVRLNPGPGFGVSIPAAGPEFS